MRRVIAEPARPRIRRPYLPSFALALVTAWLAWDGAITLSRAGRLATTLAGARHQLAGPTVIGFLVVAIACERLRPLERRPVTARGHVHDACFFLVSAVAVVPLVAVLGVASASMLATHAHWMEVPGTASWPRWLLLGVTLIAMDGCNWLTHVAEHRFAPLWRVHALHHSQEEVSVLTTFRTHPLVHTASFFAATIPVVALMGDRPLGPTLVTVYLCLGALPHANVGWTYGPLGKVLVSPSYHRVHHAADGPHDVNLGIVLPWWDMLVGRAVFPARGAPPFRTGLAGRPLGVEQQTTPSQTIRVLIGQLLEPFTQAQHA